MLPRCHNHPVPTMTDARLRAILVNYRSLDDVAARLASEALSDADVIVVDNASDPGAVEELCLRHHATAVLLPENRGFASGVNAGWQVAQGRSPLPLLLLNPDAELTREALDTLLSSLPGKDGVGPLLLEGPDRPQVGVGGGPVSVASVAAYFLFFSHLVRSWQGLFLTRSQARHGGSVSWLCMAALLLSSDSLARFGPLPEHEVVYAEDVAWGTAASRRGARFEVVASAVVSHPHGSTGENSVWVGSLERLLRRRLGGLRGGAAVMLVRTGLRLRELLGRHVRGQPASRRENRSRNAA
jgi:GT2 family glycosyltransferase